MSNYVISRMGSDISESENSSNSYSESYRSSEVSLPISKLLTDKNSVAEFDFEHMKEGALCSLIFVSCLYLEYQVC